MDKQTRAQSTGAWGAVEYLGYSDLTIQLIITRKTASSRQLCPFMK